MNRPRGGCPLIVEVPLESKFDARLLSWGVFGSLDGFMGSRNWQQVCQTMEIDGNIVGLPMSLPVSDVDASRTDLGMEVSLAVAGEAVFATMRVDELFKIDWRDEAIFVLGTDDALHPWVKKLMQWGAWRMAGPILSFVGDLGPDPFNRWLSPSQVKSLAKELSWKSFAAMQTRNPLHGAHLDLARRVMELGSVDGLLIHPAMGITKLGDLSPSQRARSYEAALVALVALDAGSKAALSYAPLAMRMAGPREAIWHAAIRKGFGATHFIVGRDHAGPGSDSKGRPFYHPEAAKELALTYSKKIGMEVLGFSESKYSAARGKYVLAEELADGEATMQITGTQMRAMIDRREALPDWFTPSQIAASLLPAPLGVVIFLTGLSASGKTTLANRLAARWQMAHGRPMSVLDGDEVRKMLSSELGFSREHRDLNVERLGFVAAEVSRHGGACVISAIAPYATARAKAMDRMRSTGCACLVHVSTSLEVCEGRDPKGLYAKARSGQLKGFTGIDDPYECPLDADLVLDMGSMGIDQACAAIEAFVASMAAP